MLDCYAQCVVCGEYREECLKQEDSKVYCFNHSPRYGATHQKGACFLCREEDVPLEKHHIARRKHYPATVQICSNCHRLISSGNNRIIELVLVLLLAQRLKTIDPFTQEITEIHWLDVDENNSQPITKLEALLLAFIQEQYDHDNHSNTIPESL